jgi:hypothetical protein
MPCLISRRARFAVILVPAACASLATISGCGSGTSIAAQPPAAPPTAVSSPPSSSQPDSPGGASPASSSGDSSSGLGAVVNVQDGQGDSYTQSFTFGSPEPESDAPDVVSGVQTCALGVAIPARNLVVPVKITTTLNSSVQTQISIQLNISQYSSDEPNAGIPGDIIYQLSSGPQCATDQPGGVVTLSQGQSATTQAWIVVQDAITPAFPNGDTAQLGTNFIYFSYAGTSDVTSAQGTAVCNGDPQTSQMESPPFLVFAGNAPSGEGCDGNYTASGD